MGGNEGGEGGNEGKRLAVDISGKEQRDLAKRKIAKNG